MAQLSLIVASTESIFKLQVSEITLFREQRLIDLVSDLKPAL